MKFSLAAILIGSTSAFSSVAFVRSSASSKTAVHMGFDLSGNSWKPDSEKMGSTDTGDYFPDDYDPNAIDYQQGMMGSQYLISEDRERSFDLPGMENLAEDAIMMGGIEQASEIPQGMDFTPPSVLDGEYFMNVAAKEGTFPMEITVQSPCMTFEDFYATFAPGSHPCWSVSPPTGRMDRRNGEPTVFTVKCTPNGATGELTGTLVINLPDDGSKLAYKFVAKSF